MVPVSVLGLALQVSGRAASITPWRASLACALPAFAFALAATNDWHRLIWSEWRVVESNGLRALVYVHGPAFWLLSSYSHALLAISGLLLIAHYSRAGRAELSEALLMCVGFSAPWLANLIYVSGRNPWPGIDLTPFGLALTGSCFALALWSRERIFDALFFAREALIDVIGDAALVADLRDRLVYANPAARSLLGIEAVALPAPIGTALAAHPELLASLRGDSDASAVALGTARADEPSPRSFDLRTSLCLGRRGRPTSRVVVLRDVTDRVQAERTARRSESWLRQAIDLVPHYLYAKDAEGRFLLANAAVARAYHRSTDEIVGRFQHELQFDADEVRRSLEGDRRVIASGRAESFEHVLREPSGRVVQLETTKIPYVDSESGRSCVLGLSIDITRQKEQAQRIDKLAYLDTLTGLPNRERFRHLVERAISRAARNSHSLALLFVDLDRFKSVNDQFGHRAGDELLQLVARRLEESVRAGDALMRSDRADPDPSVSRLGSDEFTLLLSQVADPLDPGLVAERLLATLAEPFRVGEQEIFTSASIGIAVYPHDGRDAEQLLARADQAMYAAKHGGRKRAQFFTESLNAAGTARNRIEQALHRAEARGELSLHYQPMRAAMSGRLSGAEALLRFQHPELGSVSPADFIPIAEDSGLIVPIGAYVLRSVCKQLRDWRTRGLELSRAAVNVSGRQLVESDFADIVTGVLRETRTSPAELELEITESVVMRDDAVTARNLERLHALGIGLTLDDFGTGYSSLSYLRRLPFERLKIDRSFVCELETNASDRALTGAIAALAKSLGIETIAEGVETESQAQLLRACGCDHLQGYLLSRPLPAREFERFLEREKGAQLE
jgi:diguanylate cyclase (GGDEF)-like protein/PAS domain S-box-containing protein